ncbi:MAG: hypothetical protein K6T17_00880, partial [Fimbriimonadales bacterium]|nr:hypothetical protein [Fimbriimonadales bacterium]
NWYTYCGNNPVGFADPEGTVPLALVAIVFVVALAVEMGDSDFTPGKADTLGAQLDLYLFLLAVFVPVEGMAAWGLKLFQRLRRAEPVVNALEEAGRWGKYNPGVPLRRNRVGHLWQNHRILTPSSVRERAGRPAKPILRR